MARPLSFNGRAARRPRPTQRIVSNDVADTWSNAVVCPPLPPSHCVTHLVNPLSASSEKFLFFDDTR
jgi:hypothetical protein